MFFKKIQYTVSRGISGNFDLLLLWIILIAIQPQIPVEHLLARMDLVPWLMFCLGCAVLLRGSRYGDGPHTSLTKRHSAMGFWCMRLGMITALFGLVWCYDLGVGWDIVRTTSPGYIDLLMKPIAAMFVTFLLIYFSRHHEETAWDPKGISGATIWIVGTMFVVGTAIGIGRFEKMNPVFHSEALLLGLGFLATGLVAGRAQHLRQRLASGTKDNRPYRPALFNYLFSSLGSAFGLWALYFIQDQLGLGDSVTFELAFVPAAFVVAWAGVVWKKPIPIAVTCLLHEIMPSGGADKLISTTATPFDETPEGALRINPLEIQRILITHPWLVPVKASRVPELDDPIKPLWPRREPPVAYHVLGSASFEPCKYTNAEQWSEITVRLKGSDDVGSVSGSAALNRSIVVLKPFLRPGTSRKKRITTYQWEQAVWEASIQTVDATTETLSLEDGCIIVLATEGVARAFEVEIGAPVYRLPDASGFRPPQLEDYVEV